LTASLYGKLTVDNGRVLETNFDRYLLLRLDEVPTFETYFIQATDDHFGGLSEPGTPPVAPAVCNALYRITRRRIRQLPISEYYLQVA